jgi:hypothetical protein
MSTMKLDPWIEGYLEYQRTVRRLAAKSIVDMRCTLKRAVQAMEGVRPAVALWQLTLVFWQDFVQWRNARTGLKSAGEVSPRSGERQQTEAKKPALMFTGKAAQILAEA